MTQTITLLKGRDKNGNTTIKVKVHNKRAFRIQTNGNLPLLHEQLKGSCVSCNELSHLSYDIQTEFYNYILKHGTDHQKNIVMPWGLTTLGLMRKADHIEINERGIYGSFDGDVDCIHSF